MFGTDRGKTLVHLARAAIGKEFGFKSHELPRLDWLEEPGATFVTLMLHDQLRGCIGSLEATRPLLADVRENAVAAAFRDPRFPPLTKEEFADVSIEVSLLSQPEQLQFANEEDALSQLYPGRDGVVLQFGRHRATYLPQVWAQLPTPRAFIGQLKEKAGLPRDFWSNEMRLARYTVQNWSEGENHG